MQAALLIINQFGDGIVGVNDLISYCLRRKDFVQLPWLWWLSYYFYLSRELYRICGFHVLYLFKILIFIF